MVVPGSRVTGYSAMFIDQIFGSLTSPDGGGTNIRYPQMEEIYVQLSPGVSLPEGNFEKIANSHRMSSFTSSTGFRAIWEAPSRNMALMASSKASDRTGTWCAMKP